MPPPLSDQANDSQDHDITRFLQDMSTGDKAAEAVVWARLYKDIKRGARRAMKNQPAGLTLQTTQLVGIAYERITRKADSTWKDRKHFLAYVARVMHNLLVDHARKPKLQREKFPELDSLVQDVESRVIDLIAFNDAVEQLSEVDPQMAETANLKAMGLSSEEIAESLEIPRRTLDRRWAHARAFLHQCIA